MWSDGPSVISPNASGPPSRTLVIELVRAVFERTVRFRTAIGLRTPRRSNTLVVSVIDRFPFLR